MSEFRRGALRLALCTVVLAGSSVSAPAGQTPPTVAVPVSSDTPVRMAANGYGCACFDGVVDHRSANVVRIDRLQPRPLNACLADPALPSIN
mgnify:CR=1 FL=1